MGFDDGLGLLGGGGELSHGGDVIQQAVGGKGKRNRRGPKPVTKVTYVVSRQADGSYAATASIGGGLFGGGSKKQFVAASIGELLTQLGQSARKTFAFGAQPQVQSQQYQQPRQAPTLSLGGKTCAKCNAAIPDGAAFCNNCGTKWEAPAKPKASFCTGCGSQATGLAFCGNCGTKINVQA